MSIKTISIDTELLRKANKLWGITGTKIMIENLLDTEIMRAYEHIKDRHILPKKVSYKSSTLCQPLSNYIFSENE